MNFTLNPQQREVLKGGTKWFKDSNKQVLEIVGAAGTGKTTIVRSITENLGLDHEDVLYMTFIGRAAQNLALKGLNAKTVHASIYDVVDTAKLDENGNPILRNGRPVTVPRFKLRDSIPDNIKLIVVDEAGIIDSKMGEDILSFGVPVIVLGDLEQLKPLFGKPYFLHNPDYVLTDIMRQAENSEIIWMSQEILKGRDIPTGRYNNSRVITLDELTDEDILDASMILTIRNKTRDQMNEYITQKLIKRPEGRYGNLPMKVGDKVVCRRNNWSEHIDWNGNNMYLINGMVGYVEAINIMSYNQSSIEIDFRPEFMEESYKDLMIDLEYMMTPASEKFEGYAIGNQFQFGYAISTYMAQGSQYHHPMYLREEVPRNVQKSHDYSGITRAESHITLVKIPKIYY